MCATSSNKGFTLLEVLIAVTLLGIVSAALYGSYFTVVRARERAAEGIEARRELGRTLDLIRRECASALYSRTDKRLRLIVEDRDNFGKPASRLELTTLAQPGQGRKESGILAINYQILERNKRYILTRKEQDLYNESTDVKPYPQMERISAFLVECYDGSKWVKSWDTSINNVVPKMLRITVQVEENGKPMDFSALAPFRIQAQ